MNSTDTLSILVPVYNEAAVLELFYTRISAVLDTLDLDYELLFVDDGSSDDTPLLLAALAQRDPHVKVLLFSRNFGKEAAMSAAIEHASGQAAIPIDADLQDPPELIPALVARWREGYDVVLARRASRAQDAALKRGTALAFYRLFNLVSDIQIPDNVGDFRLMDRKVLDVLKLMPEKDRFMKGLYSWPGFRQSVVEFERPERAGGTTKFNYWRLWNFALSGLTSFSTLPIRFSVYLGLFIAVCAFLFGFFIIAKTLLFGADTPGYASLMVVMLFLGGVQLFFLGLLGEYIGRIYREVKNRPLYVVARRIGFTNA
jgi:glycosyltransferase involved in cell wall biosynthesis